MPFMMTRTHGNAVVPEFAAGGRLLQVNGNPYSDVIGLAQGWGKTFRLGQAKDNWFHIPIPTITQIESSPMYLDQFYVFFKGEEVGSSVTGGIDEVHVFDGSARVSMHPSPQIMTGDWSSPREVHDRFGVRISNTWFPRRDGQRIRFFTGLGISLHAGFILEGNITFFSAGASWVDSPA
jgi:hypothetical protein